MFEKVKGYVKDLFSRNSFGLMVVNCSYYRPMTGRSDCASLRNLSDERYFEICEQIREA